MVGIEASDLLGLLDAAEPRFDELSEEAEKALVADARLLLVAICLMNHWTFEEIVRTYEIDELQGVRLLAKLDRLRIIELRPGNHVKLMLSPQFSWRKNGPIERLYRSDVQQQFFASHFDGPGEVRFFVNGMLSRTANTAMQERIRRLVEIFEEASNDDQNLPLDERFGTTLVIAMRPWELKVFTELRRSAKKSGAT